MSDATETGEIHQTATASALARAQNETAIAAVSARVQALVQAKFVMAAKMPRSIDNVRIKVKARCAVPEFAAIARYSVERGKKQDPVTGEWVTNYIEGPSIRFVEEVARHFGNIDSSTTTLYDDDDKRIVRCETMDLETNNSWSKEITITKTVERRRAKGDVLGKRVNSYGDTVYILRATDEDFATKEAAAVSKALRTLALRVLPGDIVELGQRIAVETLTSETKKNPDAARLALIDGFAKLGITPTMLAEYLGHPTEQITPEEIARLRGVGVALQDGVVSWREVLESKHGAEAPKSDPEAAKASEAKREDVEKRVAESVAKAKARAAGKTPKMPAQSDTSADPAPGAKVDPDIGRAPIPGVDEPPADYPTK